MSTCTVYFCSLKLRANLIMSSVGARSPICGNEICTYYGYFKMHTFF